LIVNEAKAPEPFSDTPIGNDFYRQPFSNAVNDINMHRVDSNAINLHRTGSNQFGNPQSGDILQRGNSNAANLHRIGSRRMEQFAPQNGTNLQLVHSKQNIVQRTGSKQFSPENGVNLQRANSKPILPPVQLHRVASNTVNPRDDANSVDSVTYIDRSNGPREVVIDNFERTYDTSERGKKKLYCDNPEVMQARIKALVEIADDCRSTVDYSTKYAKNFPDYAHTYRKSREHGRARSNISGSQTTQSRICMSSTQYKEHTTAVFKPVEDVPQKDTPKRYAYDVPTITKSVTKSIASSFHRSLNRLKSGLSRMSPTPDPDPETDTAGLSGLSKAEYPRIDVKMYMAAVGTNWPSSDDKPYMPPPGSIIIDAFGIEYLVERDGFAYYLPIKKTGDGKKNEKKQRKPMIIEYSGGTQ
jgi:hypothetical protein